MSRRFRFSGSDKALIGSRPTGFQSYGKSWKKACDSQKAYGLYVLAR